MKDDKKNFFAERRKVRERSRSNSALRVMKVMISNYYFFSIVIFIVYLKFFMIIYSLYDYEYSKIIALFNLKFLLF